MAQPPINGTQKGDIYSFAIVVQEIAYRAQPYFCDKIEPKGWPFFLTRHTLSVGATTVIGFQQHIRVKIMALNEIKTNLISWQTHDQPRHG
jgi:hypothetical protein